MSNSEANLVPANNSVANKTVCNNNDEIADTKYQNFYSRQKRHK